MPKCHIVGNHMSWLNWSAIVAFPVDFHVLFVCLQDVVLLYRWDGTLTAVKSRKQCFILFILRILCLYTLLQYAGELQREITPNSKLIEILRQQSCYHLTLCDVAV